MNIRTIRSSLRKNLSNIPGWSTNRHLVVIESDDWGSIRMPSREAFESLSAGGIDLLSDEGYQYNKNDSLATSSDLAALFEVLESVKDVTGRHAVMTPIAVVANPDFGKILQSGFSEYYFEPFTETLKRYNGCSGSYLLWKTGIVERIFVPQFHGREHLNVPVWMKALKSGNENARKAFMHGLWGISTAGDPTVRIEFQAAFDYMDPGDLVYHKEVIETGLDLFYELFGYRAVYFVPPNGAFSSKLEPVCFTSGIRYLSVPRLQVEPTGKGSTVRRYHWLGQKSRSGLTYLVRNCFFEPVHPGQDWVDRCLWEVSMSFKWKKPAIIGSHRLNYIGALNPANRDNGLKQLQLLLTQIVKCWPDTEFITTSELGEIISGKRTEA